jgi:hypothetical protein
VVVYMDGRIRVTTRPNSGPKRLVHHIPSETHVSFKNKLDATALAGSTAMGNRRQAHISSLQGVQDGMTFAPMKAEVCEHSSDCT